MSNLTFVLPSEDISNTTPNLSAGSINALYPLVNISNGNPALPAKFTSTTAFWYWDFGSAVQVKRVSILNHNFDNGLTGVSAVAGATTACAGYTLGFTIPSHDDDGYTVSPHVDPSASGAFRYWGINIGNANSVNLIIGEVVITITTPHVLTDNIGFASALGEMHGVTTQKTNAGVQLTYQRGERIKSIRNAPISTTDWPTIQQWRRACRGNSKPHLLIPDTTVNEAWYGKWDMAGDALSMNFGKQGPLVRDVQFNWTEVSRGLPWSDV